MNKELKILLNDNKNLVLYWDKINGADSYTIIGLNDSFYKERIKTTKENIITLEKKDYKDFIKLGVLFQKVDTKTKKEIVFGETNMINITNNDIDSIKITSINSYNGITLSFRSSIIYDKYFLYEKKNNQLKLLLETEDWQITSNKFKEGNEYYVEAYITKDDNYQLAGKSSIYTCKFEKINNKPAKELTVVIPTYNAEKFLSRCIDSILLSTLKGIEIVIINDGSTDSSEEIMNWYKDQYNGLITTYSQENKGVSFARNKGIELVNTPYIAFIDSDDMVHPFMYEKLYDFAINNRLDVVIAKTIIREDYGKKEYCLIPTKEKPFVYTFDKMAEESENNTYENIFFHSACNKILKTQLAKDHPFPDHNEYEDIAFTMNVYSYIDYFGFVPDAYYVWDQRFRQIMSSLSTRYFEKNSPFNIQQGYSDSVFYCCHHGNPKRINYLAYHSIKMAYTYLKEAKIDLFNNVYQKEIIELSKKMNLLVNKYVLKDHELFVFIHDSIKKSK